MIIIIIMIIATIFIINIVTIIIAVINFINESLFNYFMNFCHPTIIIILEQELVKNVYSKKIN